MKQKMVIKVSTNGQKSRKKVLKLAVGFSGVDSVSFGGQDKSQLEVTGEGVDPVELTTLLRKRLGRRTCLINSMGYAELVSVSPVGGKKD